MSRRNKNTKRNNTNNKNNKKIKANNLDNKDLMDDWVVMEANNNRNSKEENKMNAMKNKWLQFNKITEEELKREELRKKEEQKRKEEEYRQEQIKKEEIRKSEELKRKEFENKERNELLKRKEDMKNIKYKDEVDVVNKNVEMNREELKPKKSTSKLFDVPNPTFLSPPKIAFKKTLKAYSPIILEKDSNLIEQGNRVILPLGSLQEIIDLEIKLPVYITIITNKNKKLVCGVIDSTAEKGTMVVPYWIMEKLQINEGDSVNIESISIEKGTYVKLQPKYEDFYEDIENPAALFENIFGFKIVTITKGDSFVIQYLGKQYEINVLELKPHNTVQVMDTMLTTDFEKAEIDNNVVHYIEVGGTKKGEMNEGDYSHFILNCKNEDLEGKNLIFKLEKNSGDPFLFVSQDIKKPNILNHKWSLMDSSTNTINVHYSKAKYNSSIFYISVLSFKAPSSFSLSIELEKSYISSNNVTGSINSNENSSVDKDFQRCSTCRRLIPINSYSTHSIFCARNNFYCEKCDIVMHISSKAKHIHCQICDKGFNDESDLEKHNHIYHSAIICECGEELSLNALKEHKLLKCPKRKVKCNNCELEYFFNEIHKCTGIKKFEKCSFCGKNVSVVNLEEHLEYHEKMGK